LPKVAKCLGH